MSELSLLQCLAVGLVFVWSGFVRTGLGFGGSVLSLPFFLLIADDPLIFLPPIAIHLLIFSSWILLKNTLGGPGASTQPSNIHWPTLVWSMKIMIIPKLIGVVGLLTIPPVVMSSIILAIVSVYALSYLFDRPFQSQNPWISRGLLALGGYVSGASLTGAPLIIPVIAQRVEKHQLRDTLFVLWFVLVLIKMTSFLIAGVDLQLVHQVWLFPCALVGHLLGERFHSRIVASETPIFFRVLGGTLLLVALAGLLSKLS